MTAPLRDALSLFGRVLPWALLCLVGAAFFDQLLVPPIVGLSDNGDFPREIGWFGYAAAQKVPNPKWVYVAPTYVPAANTRQLGYEHSTPDLALVGIAVALGKLFAGGVVPITLVGVLHSIGVLAALARLIVVAQNIWLRVAIAAGAVIMLTDVGYVAYANSFFAESSSEMFALWTIAETISACRKHQAGPLFICAGTLLIWAKAQNAPLALPLAAFVLLVGGANLSLQRLFGAAFLVLTGILEVAAVEPRAKLDTSYNMLFSAVLPESRDPRGDLRSLGLDPELVQWKGTYAWSGRTGLGEESVRAVMKRAGPFAIMRFYLERPTRLWRHITTLFPIASQLRPEACGNFMVSAGRPPGARATRYAVWSMVHERAGSWLKYLLFGLVGTLMAAVKLWSKFTLAPVMALLPALCLTAFLTAAFGDAAEPVKHQFLFNLLLDATIVGAVASTGELLWRKRRAVVPGGTLMQQYGSSAWNI